MKNVVRIIAAALALIMVISLAACAGGTKPSNSGRRGSNAATRIDNDNSSRLKFPKYKASDLPISIAVKDCYSNSGYYVFIANEDLELTADFGGEDALEWAIFVLDSQYSDKLVSLPEKYQPSLSENGGSFTVKTGQYVYVYCPVNELTSAPSENASSLTLTGKALG